LILLVHNAAPVLGQEIAAVAQQPPAAQATPAESPATNGGRLSFTGGVDLLSSYMFRGIRQDDRGLIAWPAGEVGVVLFQGQGSVKSVGVTIGLWNSLHSGPTGNDGPTGKMWYESDFYSGLTLSLKGGAKVGANYTAYVSPNNSFATVKEVGFTFAFDDSARPLPFNPYALIAVELDGQADGGERSGTYLELGARPGVSLPTKRLAIALPVKVGLSLKDYYEGAGGSNTFGYVEAGAVATVPLSFVPPGFGVWSVRGGLSVLGLGTSLQALNGGRRAKVVGLFGAGLSY
jgi:hypothetical protein